MQGNLGLTPVQAPCKGCADRHTGCHTDCTRYIAFRREADRYKQEQSKDAARYATTRGCIDVTDGNMPGSVMVAGRVLADRLSLASAAKTALSGKGFTFVDAPEITRGYTVTYDKNDGSGTPPVDENVYTEGSYADVSTEYPLTKSGNTQTGWSTSKGGAAVSKVEMTGNVTLYPVWTTP